MQLSGYDLNFTSNTMSLKLMGYLFQVAISEIDLFSSTRAKIPKDLIRNFHFQILTRPIRLIRQFRRLFSFAQGIHYIFTCSIYSDKSLKDRQLVR